jgi:CHAT domain-containing protein/tetratricopeptide (TPR) repeat protein
MKWWLKLVVAGLAFSAPLLASAQTADQLLAEARKAYTEQGASIALPLYERTLAAYQAAHDRHGEAITLGLIGNCYKRLGQHAKALDSLNRALTMKRELGDRNEEGKTLSHLGLVYWEIADYPKAIETLSHSLAIAREIHDRVLEAAALNNLSLVYDEQGNYHRSLEQYEQALALHRAAGYAPGESDTLGNIGGVYLTLGHYSEASKYYEQALIISRRLQSKASESEDLGNLAACQLGMGRIREALHTYDEALGLARQAGLAKEEADWRRGRGTALLRLGQYDQARSEYKTAAAVYERADLKRELLEALTDDGTLLQSVNDLIAAEASFADARELAKKIGNAHGVAGSVLALAGIEWKRQQYQKAASLSQEALAVARTAKDDGTMSAALVLLAFTLRDQHKFDEALARAQQALEQAHATGSRLSETEASYTVGEMQRAGGDAAAAITTLESVRQQAAEIGDTELQWRAAYSRGQALESANRTSEALQAYRDAVTIIEDVRNQLHEERFRAGYIQDRYVVYVALVDLLLKLGDIPEAFSTAERLRSRSYLDRLHPALAGGEAEELRSRVQHLQRVLDLERAKPAHEQRGDAIHEYSDELLQAQRRYQALLDDAAARELVERSTRSVEAREVQAALAKDTALIEYIVGTDSVAVFVLTRAGIQGLSLPISARELRAKTELLRDLIARRSAGAEWLPVAASLRATLLTIVEERGWLANISRLEIVPHAELHSVPFALLSRPAGRALVEDYVLSYLPSAGTLLQPRAGKARAANMLVLAPAVTQLPFALEEARAVGQIFGVHAKLLLGTDATESAFKAAAPGYQILHLATHGYINRVNPLFSAVQFQATVEDDGRLEVHEILQLKLHAQLVTLSACETALGTGLASEAPPGDEVVGLAQAFLSAGSSSVLAALWNVNDRSGMEFMRTFYRALSKHDIASALANAQRAMLHGPAPYRHPYYWAPFMLLGKAGADVAPGPELKAGPAKVHRSAPVASTRQ